MRAEDLRSREMLGQDPATGFPLLGSLRIMALGMGGLGRLNQDIIECLGWEKMRVLLKRFGYDSGLSHAAVIARLYEFDDTREWFKAGSVMRSLAGLADEELRDIEFGPEFSKIHFTGIWKASIESVIWQNLLGTTTEPICCILEGIASGYASAVLGTEVLVKEISCEAQGNSHCVFEGRTIAEWGLSPETFREQLKVADVKEELDQLKRALEKANRHIVSQKEVIRDLKQHVHQNTDQDIIFRSRSIKEVLIMAEKVAPTAASVLIQGESGTGKEVLAKIIHEQSGRKSAPFQAINCAALPANLLESELFGHVKGAFTGAEADKTGLFVEAGQGTIFLDEIGSLPLELQAKLLRVTQEKKVQPVGGTRFQSVQARIISATNQDLKEMTENAEFREDLFFRLSVFPIFLPPLKKRREDILPLARYFLNRAHPGHEGFSPEAVRKLETYDWPGNIRELENWVEYAVILAGGAERIKPEHLPGPEPDKQGRDPLFLAGQELPTVRELERRYIDYILEKTGGNKTRAAEILGISISTLWRRLNLPE